jgi:hypothetical protein
MKIKSPECRLRFILFLNSNDHFFTETEKDFLLKDLEKDADEENII